MDIEQTWNKALRETEIIRGRVSPLLSTADTFVSYILLSESTVNQGDTVVRKGEMCVGKPSIIIPPNHPQFHGFEFDKNNLINEDTLTNFLFIRGIRLPSLIYDNKTSSLQVFEGKLSNAIQHYKDLLQKEENTKSGLLIGPEDCWQFSLLIFICSQIVKNSQGDIRRLLEEYHRKGQE